MSGKTKDPYAIRLTWPEKFLITAILSFFALLLGAMISNYVLKVRDVRAKIERKQPRITATVEFERLEEAGYICIDADVGFGKQVRIYVLPKEEK